MSTSTKGASQGGRGKAQCRGGDTTHHKELSFERAMLIRGDFDGFVMLEYGEMFEICRRSDDNSNEMLEEGGTSTSHNLVDRTRRANYLNFDSTIHFEGILATRITGGQVHRKILLTL